MTFLYLAGTTQVLEECLVVEAKVDRLMVEVLAGLSLEDWVRSYPRAHTTYLQILFGMKSRQDEEYKTWCHQIRYLCKKLI